MDFSTNELEMILSSLKAEGRALRNIMNDLEHRKLHNGDQNVHIQMRIHEIGTIVAKIENELISNK